MTDWSIVRLWRKIHVHFPNLRILMDRLQVQYSITICVVGMACNQTISINNLMCSVKALNIAQKPWSNQGYWWRWSTAKKKYSILVFMYRWQTFTCYSRSASFKYWLVEENEWKTALDLKDSPGWGRRWEREVGWKGITTWATCVQIYQRDWLIGAYGCVYRVNTSGRNYMYSVRLPSYQGECMLLYYGRKKIVLVQRGSNEYGKYPVNCIYHTIFFVSFVRSRHNVSNAWCTDTPFVLFFLNSQCILTAIRTSIIH